MKLKDYLKVNNLTSKEFSKIINVSEISISRYLNNSRFPNMKVLKRIFQYTGGSVTSDDFVGIEKNSKRLSIDEKKEILILANDIKKGRRGALARSITMVESSLEKDQKKADYLLSKLKPGNKSIRIGVTGVPGVGKSTFIESLGLKLIDENLKVAVLAVDPSSKISGGSILGDKTRMDKLSTNENAFVRPSPSGGQLGGVARKTRESISCFEAAKYDIIFIETMGVGQAETEVYNMVDIFLVLLLPAGGDDLQGIKKGIIELADLIIINKSDSTMKGIAASTLSEYSNALSIIKKNRLDHSPKVLKCSSLKLTGLNEVSNEIKEFCKIRKNTGSFFLNRQNQNRDWLWDLTKQKMFDYFEKEIKKGEISKLLKNKIKKNEINVGEASNLLLTSFIKKI